MTITWAVCFGFKGWCLGYPVYREMESLVRRLDPNGSRKVGSMSRLFLFGFVKAGLLGYTTFKNKKQGNHRTLKRKQKQGHQPSGSPSGTGRSLDHSIGPRFEDKVPTASVRSARRSIQAILDSIGGQPEKQKRHLVHVPGLGGRVFVCSFVFQFFFLTP